MKLWKDFGVRALLATICGCGFYVALIIVLWYKMDMMSTETLLALLSLAQAPLMLALGFYFGTKAEK